MLKWTASSQRLHELSGAQQHRVVRRQRRERRATIANKENVPSVGYTSTPMPLARLRNSPLVLAPLSDIGNVTPESKTVPSPQTARLVVQSVRYAATLPRYEEEYSPSAGAGSGPLPSGQHLALRGMLPLDPFLEQPRYIHASTQPLKKRKLEADFLATMEEQPVKDLIKPQTDSKVPRQQKPPPLRPVTPQPSTNMGDQTLDKLIDAILDSACKADDSNRKKPRKSFNLRRRTLVKQQLESECHVTMLSPSYAPGDDPASDLSFAMLPMPMPMPIPATPEPASPLTQLPHSVLLRMPTPQPQPQPQPQPRLQHQPHVQAVVANSHSDTFCLATPVRPLKRSRCHDKQSMLNVASVDVGVRAGVQMEAESDEVAVESPLKRYKVDARNYFEVGLALPSSIYV